jgi:hypothetical protein
MTKRTFIFIIKGQQSCVLKMDVEQSFRFNSYYWTIFAKMHSIDSQVKPVSGGAEAKASPNKANKLAAVDAKPRELHMGRMKGG